MNLLRVTFLGTSAAQPTPGRGLSATALRRAGALWLFDCGEGTQRQMFRFGTGLDLEGICFTHFHADHYLGVIGLVRTLSMNGRVAPLRICGPAPARALLERMLNLVPDELSFPLEITELADGDEVRLEDARLRAFTTDHRIASLGYSLLEDARPGRFHPERALAQGVPPGPLFGELQHGRSVVVDGRAVSPAEVVEPPRRGRHLVLSGDTRPCAATIAAARGADLLIHEATFGDAEQERAELVKHSTAREAARIAREAGVQRLVLTHLSSRYDTEPSRLLAEAREAFEAVEIAHDGLSLELALPG
jgi:ribonuclease Z